MVNKLPALARQLCYGFDAWITGSAALANANFYNDSIKDVDLIVPLAKWNLVAIYLSHLQDIPGVSFKLNTFGGWKISGLDEVQYDVWAADFAEYMTYFKTAVVWHPKSGCRWIKFVEKE